MESRLLQYGMIGVVIFSILLFVIMIIVGHATAFNFSQDATFEQVFVYGLNNMTLT